MTKRLIDIDDELLADAQAALNTSGVSDTVRSALRQASVAAARADEIEWLISGGMAEMADKKVREDVWRWSRDTSSTPALLPEPHGER